jgi:DUF1016 N-terminal domain
MFRIPYVNCAIFATCGEKSMIAAKRDRFYRSHMLLKTFSKWLYDRMAGTPTKVKFKYGEAEFEFEGRKERDRASAMQDFEEQIVSALRRQLNWTQIKTLMYFDDPLKRSFYIEICGLEGWSSRQLQERIDSMLFERTAISRKPEDPIHRPYSKAIAN